MAEQISQVVQPSGGGATRRLPTIWLPSYVAARLKILQISLRCLVIEVPNYRDKLSIEQLLF